MSYIIALCFVKLSILFFYRAIASHRTFRRLVYATIVFVCLYSFAACIAAVFQCENPSDAWSTANYFAQFDRNPDTRRQKLKCYDPVKLWVFSAAANLLTDIIILMLPIPTLLSLRIPMSKRLALIGIFSVGIMAIIASSVRVWVLRPQYKLRVARTMLTSCSTQFFPSPAIVWKHTLTLYRHL
jgi:hypothetical protein